MSPDIKPLTPRQRTIAIELFHFVAEKKMLPRGAYTDLLAAQDHIQGEMALHILTDLYVQDMDLPREQKRVQNLFELLQDFQGHSKIPISELTELAREHCAPIYKHAVEAYQSKKTDSTRRKADPEYRAQQEATEAKIPGLCAKLIFSQSRKRRKAYCRKDKKASVPPMTD